LRENRLRGLTSRAVGEKTQKVSDSHRNDVSPLTQGLRYRAACDTPTRPNIVYWFASYTATATLIVSVCRSVCHSPKFNASSPAVLVGIR